ncbi:MAG: ATP-binding cassette domain-containing protein, partial [Acidobacteriaceae bacterium]|nr:ATP-binding cassette domain-containing protein [Acidobacteriaceae bacterium]
TSNMDCGPASLKCLLEGFGRPVSYGRLREACQTGLDGTSIDTMEAVANQLGLHAEQIMLPVDHLLISARQNLPAIVVVKLPNGLTHFVVVWSRHGPLLQIMDPSIGRRWTPAAQFAHEIYSHTMKVPAADWRDFAASQGFQTPLQMHLRRLGIAPRQAKQLAAEAVKDASWWSLAVLDASIRLTASLRRARAVTGGREARCFIERLCAAPDLIPERYWSVRPAEPHEGEEQVRMRGAVLVRICGRRADPVTEDLGPELQAAIEQKPIAPVRELIAFLRQSGRAAIAMVSFSLAAAGGAVVIEALLFRGLFDLGSHFGFSVQRLAAIAAILLFTFALLLLETSIFSGTARLGRQIENRLRVAFLAKIPRLSDRYFQSRLTSDMAERSHAAHRIRHVPELGRQLLRATFELLATAVAMIWLAPSATPFVVLIVAVALLPSFTAQSVLAERDLRVRSHAAGLMRFYLDAMLGLMAVRAHSAETSVRREHEKLIGEWAHAALRLQKTVLSLEALQLIVTFALVAALLFAHSVEQANIGRVLLLVYWALNLPALGQEIVIVSRQYPYYRNLTLRLLDPLGAPEEPLTRSEEEPVVPLSNAPPIDFRDVTVEVSGYRILEQIRVRIEPATRVAIVGPSGAGKSSLVGILLGWLKPSEGAVLIDGEALDCDVLRASTAWVDPAVQLWNRSLLANLSYGSQAAVDKVGNVVDAALLRSLLEALPHGLDTVLGEGGALVSGGEGQRVRLGRAMLRQNVQLVILDEPFRGLDREKRRELLARAREFWHGRTLLCITHDVSETQVFDRVLVLEHGRIIEDGTPAELTARPESRYAQLLEAERQTRAGLWCSAVWRRIRIHSGRIVEEHNKPAEEKRLETEVA